MNIVLTETRRSEGRLDSRHYTIPHYVVHFGSNPPDKQRIVVSGRDVGEHHAKLFFSRGRFWLINLCGLPCALLKTSGRTVFLTVTDEATDVRVGESFQIGNSTFMVEALVPPELPPPPPLCADPGCVQEIRSRRTPLETRGIRRPADPAVWEAALRMSSELLGETTFDELWRKATDSLDATFRSRWQASPPQQLVVAATRISDDDEPPNEPIFSTSRHEIPARCFLAAAEVAIADDQPIICRCEHDSLETSIDLLASPVAHESTTIGALVLAACWENPPEWPRSLDDIFLFEHIVTNLSWALTSLRQRKAARKYCRMHDLGTSVMDEKHETYHLINRAFWAVDDLSDRFQCLATPPDVTADIDKEFRRLRYVLEQLRSLGRTTLDFMKYAETGDARVIKPDMYKDCGGVMRQMLDKDLIEWRIKDACVTVHIGVDLGDERFLGMPEWIVAAIANLQDNAVKSLRHVDKEHTFVSLNVTCEQDEESGLPYIVLSVADNGPGIPERLRGQIFRGRIADSDTGHGIGSRIVRRVMDDHIGMIRFATEEQVGTLVQLWFPHLESGRLDERKKYLEARRPLGELEHQELQSVLTATYDRLFQQPNGAKE